MRLFYIGIRALRRLSSSCPGTPQSLRLISLLAPVIFWCTVYCALVCYSRSALYFSALSSIVASVVKDSKRESLVGTRGPGASSQLSSGTCQRLDGMN